MDFILTWVDDSDPEWQRTLARYAATESVGDAGHVRFRDWGNLHYWFRGVEQFAPWVDTIHFVTCGQVPSWLNTDHPKLNLVSHADFIPREYLPTFNSRTIELNFNRIPGLSREYVYFNDDMFLIDRVEPGDFFRNGKPCDMAILMPLFEQEYSHTLLANILALNRHIEDKRKTILKNPANWFHPAYGMKNIRNLLLGGYRKYPGFISHHLPQALLRDTLDLLWCMEPEALDRSCQHVFRRIDTVNMYLQRYWELAHDNFHPMDMRRKGTVFGLSSDSMEKAANFITNQEKPMICINDDGPLDMARARATVNQAFAALFPDKSAFEL